MEGAAGRASEARKIKLSGIKYYQKVYKGAQLTVRGGTYIGQISVQGSELIGDVNEQRGGSRKPAALSPYDSKTREGDVVCLPVSVAGEDDLTLDWTAKGRSASTDLGRLLVAKGIQIPDGSRWTCELYMDNDPDLGVVIGMKVIGAQFLPMKPGKPRKAKTPQPK